MALTQQKSKVKLSSSIDNREEDSSEERSYEAGIDQTAEEDKKFKEFWRGINRGVQATNKVSQQYFSATLLHLGHQRTLVSASLFTVLVWQ